MKDNTITLKTEHQDEVVLWLDPTLVNLSRPVIVTKANGQALSVTANPNVETFCVALEGRADPRLAAPQRIVVDLRN